MAPREQLETAVTGWLGVPVILTVNLAAGRRRGINLPHPERSNRDKRPRGTAQPTRLDRKSGERSKFYRKCLALMHREPWETQPQCLS